MHSTETRQKFIVLRAKNRGLCGIAEELGISPGTAYTWDSQFQDEIAQLRAMEIEAIRERILPNYQQELSYLADELKRVQAILRQRDYGYVNTDQLYWYQSHLLSRIDRKCPPLPPPKRPDLPAVTTVTPRPAETESLGHSNDSGLEGADSSRNCGCNLTGRKTE